MTRQHLARTVRRAEITATLLRMPGAHVGAPQRRQIANDLEALAGFARPFVDPERVPVYDQTADDDACEADLLGGAA